MQQEGMQQRDDQPVDALDSVSVQDRAVATLLEGWTRATDQLRQDDHADVRWQRGTDVKMLLEHLAVREEAIGQVVRRLERLGSSERAAELDGDGTHRRELIAGLDEQVRGVLPWGTNNPQVDTVLEELGPVLDAEQETHRRLLPTLGQELGPPGERGLPSARYVRAHAVTHVNPTPAWYDKIGPLRAVRALYDHLRGHPGAGLAPSVGDALKHVPGVHR